MSVLCVCVRFVLVCRRARTCDCDAASREHLYSSFEMFDPVRDCRMELWFITDKHTNTVKYHTQETFDFTGHRMPAHHMLSYKRESEADCTNAHQHLCACL